MSLKYLKLIRKLKINYKIFNLLKLIIEKFNQIKHYRLRLLYINHKTSQDLQGEEY